MNMQRVDRFLDRLKTWLSEEGHTKLWLAREVGISRSHLDKILSGNCNLSLDTADRIADAVEIPLEVMLGRSTENVLTPA